MMWRRAPSGSPALRRHAEAERHELSVRERFALAAENEGPTAALRMSWIIARAERARRLQGGAR